MMLEEYDVKGKYEHDDLMYEHGMKQETMKGVKVPQTYEGS
jgi:hypothetical protein